MILAMTDQPIKKAMNKPEVVGQMIQWVVKLSQFNIEYRPRIAIKAQVLADFITEFTMPKESPTSKLELWKGPKGRGGVEVIITSQKETY